VNLEELKSIVAEQAEDEGLWFIAVYATEAYLQQALRDLHRAIEEVEQPKTEEIK